MSYIGNSPNLGALSSQILSGDGSTAFTLSYPSGSAASLGVYISGVHQVPTTDYSVAVSTITFVVAPPTGTNNISIVFYGLPATIGVPGDGTVTDAKIIAMDATKLTGTIASARLSNVDLTTLSASNLTSGTVADARFPAVLPAISGANLTSLPSDITKQSTDPTGSTNPAGGVGSIILNTTSGEMFSLTDATAGANIWTNIGDGTGQAPPINYMSATGGTITTDGNFKVHIFTTSGTFTSTIGDASVGDFVEYLVIAGGASASGRYGGGGGAGGYRNSYSSETSGGGGTSESALTLSSTTYTVTIGAGGAAVGTVTGNNGANSVFGSITSIGGGGGGSGAVLGNIGGSGGGGGNSTAGVTYPGAAGTANQGYAGGSGLNTSNDSQSGGGGGAGAVGVDSVNASAGAGGAGMASSITGSVVTRAGGGGGGGYGPSGGVGGAGGTGGGGAGNSTSSGTGGSGTVNTGSGSGSSGASGTSGSGGSGIVIIRYQFQV